mmetsp:Transcript_3488/g.8152  ORF Transcript_3488/g.8152 Transcript_3488/m.8152 type:complete len:246 (+) Transcript_3488:245-982(+)
MGAMLSATELAFGKNEVRSADSMSHALVRIGVMGGLTMVCMNILGAWSCVEGAAGISDASWLPLGKDYHTPQDHECLREYCVKTNTVWAFVSAMTGALLCAAGMARSKSLLLCFFAVVTARAFFCLIEVVMAAGLRSPCPLISLIAAPWTFFVTLFQLGAFTAVAIRYFHILNKAAAVHSAALRVRDKGALKPLESGSEQSSMGREGAVLEDGRMVAAGRKAMESLAEVTAAIAYARPTPCPVLT